MALNFQIFELEVDFSLNLLLSIHSKDMNCKYTIEDIPGKGKGIVSQEFIAKGAEVYRTGEDDECVAVDDDELEQYLTTVADIEETLNHGYCIGNVFYDLTSSESRFCNHSSNPNCLYIPERDVSIALRDIKAGEEITEDYFSYAVAPNYDRLMKQYVGGNFRDQSVHWQ